MSLKTIEYLTAVSGGSEDTAADRGDDVDVRFDVDVLVAAGEGGVADWDAAIFGDGDITSTIFFFVEVHADFEGATNGDIGAVLSRGCDAELVHLLGDGERSAVAALRILNDSVTLLGVVVEDVAHIDGFGRESFTFDGSEVFSLVGVIVSDISEGKEFSLRIPVLSTSAPLVGGAAVSIHERGNKGQSKESNKKSSSRK